MDNLCEEGRRVIIWDGLDIYTYVWTVWDWNLMMNSNHYFRDGFYINPSRSSHILYVRLILLCNFTAQEFTAVVSKISTVLISWQFLKKKIFWRILVNQTRSCSYACCFSLRLSIQCLVICVVRKYSHLLAAIYCYIYWPAIPALKSDCWMNLCRYCGLSRAKPVSTQLGTTDLLYV